MYSLYMGPNDPQQDRVPKRDLIIFSEMYSLYMDPNDPQHDRAPERDLKFFREIDHVHGSLNGEHVYGSSKGS